MGSNKRKPKRKSPVLKILLSIVVIGLLLALSYCLYSIISFKATDSLGNKAKDSYLIKTEGLEKTVVVLEDSEGDISGVWQVVYDTETVDSVVYYIPQWVYSTDYSGVFEQYIAVGDYKYAGGILDENRDIEYSLWQLINLTGVPADSYIWIDSEGLEKYQEIFGEVEMKKNSSDLLGILDEFSFFSMVWNSGQLPGLNRGIHSNLNRTGLYGRLNTVKEILGLEETNWIDLSDEYATSEAITETGKSISVVDLGEIDNQLDKYMPIIRNRDLEREQVKVEVFNGSDVTGSAARYSRRVRNAGLRVVRYDNAPESYENTTVYIVDKDRCNDSMEIVKKLLTVDVDVIEDRPDFMTTGDIIIVLGKDLKGELTWER